MSFDAAIQLFKEVVTNQQFKDIAVRISAHKANKLLDSNKLSACEKQYLAIQTQLAQLSYDQHAENISLQQERLALEKQQIMLQTQLSKEHLAHLHMAHQKDIELRLQEIQANYDNKNWAGVLSRQEAQNLLSQTATTEQPRLLMIVSEPDVSKLCPPSFQEELGKNVRGKLKQFLEKHYPAHSDTAVEFYGKFFKSAVFDTEVKQIEHVLTPLHLATIFSDVMRKEIMFHLRLWFGADAPAFSLAIAFPWKEEQKRLMADGMDEEDSLDEVQNIIVAIHQLLAAMLADIYFLWLNPLHEPRLFTLPTGSYHADWLETVIAEVRDIQDKRLDEYERELRARERELHKKEEDEKQRKDQEWQSWQQIGKYKVRDGLAVDAETGLMWLRFAIGQKWENGTAQGEAKQMTWNDAFLHAAGLNKRGGYGGYTDWRLPTIEELKTLIDKAKGKKGNYINANAFPNNKPANVLFFIPDNYYWSSSVAANGNFARLVDFSQGREVFDSTKVRYYTRLVRVAQ